MAPWHQELISLDNANDSHEKYKVHEKIAFQAFPPDGVRFSLVTAFGNAWAQSVLSSNKVRSIDSLTEYEDHLPKTVEQT